MRCLNCGWENPNGISLCEKCKSSLLDESLNNLNANGDLSDNITKTVKGSNPDQPYLDVGKMTGKTPQEESVELTYCRNCGYPIRGKTIQCPKCHYQLTAEKKESNPPFPESSLKKTINPYKQSKESACYLKPVPRENELELTTNEYQGTNILLNRKSLEPGNPTITQKTQAELIFEEGRWYISDRSEHHTTFLQIKEKNPLSDGDVLLIGDRLFIFNTQK